MAKQVDRNSVEYIVLNSQRIAILKAELIDISRNFKGTRMATRILKVLSEDLELVKKLENLGE
jgi:hypothetical protein